MAPRTAIVLATVLLAVSTAAAQQPPSGSGWRLDLRADAALLQFREDLMVPLRHVGPAVGVRLDLARRSDLDVHCGHLRLAGGAGFDRFGHTGLAFSLSASYAYLRHVDWLEQRGVALALGAAVVGRIDDLYLIDWDDAHLYWMTSYRAGPAGTIHTRTRGGRRVTAAIEVPLVSFLGRPPPERRHKVDDLAFVRTWFALPHSDLAFGLAGRYFAAVDARVGYALTRRTDLVYDLSFRAQWQPQYAAVLEHSVGLAWRIGGQP